MRRPCNDLLLQLRCQVHKIIAVPGNTHDQIPVIVRVTLGLAQQVAVDNVELDVMPVHFKIGSNQVGRFCNPSSPFKT